MSSRFELEMADRFLAGTVGEPGDRTFYFQVTVGRSSVSFKCEKFHVGGLADHLAKLLIDLPSLSAVSEPFGALAMPVFAEWSVGNIALGYEPSQDRIVIELHEVEDDSIPVEDRGRVRYFISRAHAKAFVDNGPALVGAGRPTCRLCGSSIDPDGFNCVCFN